jgi:pimeloyl-ACP methyl ester carboxylesterase
MSMSPGGERDNYPYLLETNLRLEGRSQEYIDRLQNEIVNGFRIIEQGGTYGQFLSATTTFHQDPWVRTFAPAGPQSEKDYDREVMKCRGQKWTSPVNYREIMQGISCPTLAMFGEKDLVVDWKETQAFYRSALANNKRFTSLTFPDCNHALARCVSGSRREMDEKALYQMDTVCVDAMMAWLQGVVRVDRPTPPQSSGVPSPASPAR